MKSIHLISIVLFTALFQSNKCLATQGQNIIPEPNYGSLSNVVEKILGNQEILLKQTKAKQSEVEISFEEKSEASNLQISKIISNQVTIINQTKPVEYDYHELDPEPIPAWTIYDTLATGIAVLMAIIILIASHRWSKKLGHYSSLINNSQTKSEYLCSYHSLVVRFIGLYLLFHLWGIITYFLDLGLNFIPISSNTNIPNQIASFARNRVGTIGRIIIFFTLGYPMLKDILKGNISIIPVVDNSVEKK